MRARIALLALLVLIPLLARAQAPPSPFEEEAPETLLDLELGDADVSFFGSGSWTTGIAPAFGWTVSRAGDGSVSVTPGYAFPGLETEPFFNRAEMTLSLWLLERYFFETTLSDDLADSTLLLGYAGRSGESVQSVLVGNTAIGIGAYPYLGFGDESGTIGQDAPGASALFETPVSEHELMVRFAPAQESEIVFADGGIVSETRVDAFDYERSRHFVLPDGNLDFLTIYAESADGPFTDAAGNRYRRVDLGRETAFSLADGTVSFATAPQARVLVYYEVGGVPVGDTSLGADAYFALTDAGHPDPSAPRDFSYSPSGAADYLTQFGDLPPEGLTAEEYFREYFTATIDGDRVFLLHEPGRYAPFAYASFYPSSGGPAASLSLERPSGARFASSLVVEPFENRGVVSMGGADPDPRAYENRYPLASGLVGDAEARAELAGLYGPTAASVPNAPELVTRTVQPTQQITLPDGYIPGSVRVVRNGVSESGFVVGDDGGIVFDRPLAATDVVRVSYRTSASGEAGDLLFATGNRFSIVPGLTAELALGARWKPVDRRYSTRSGQYPGRLTLSGGLDADSAARRNAPTDDRFQARLRGALSLSTPDTSGALRLAGMNDNSRTVPVNPTSLFPAPPSGADPDDSDGSGPADGPIEPADLAPNLRGRLLYVDHYQASILGDRRLLGYDAPGTSVTRYPYEAGGRIGPYPASSFDAGYGGTVAVFEYEIPSGRTWVGGLLRIDGGSGADLSDARTLVVPYRVLEATGSAELLLQIGAVGEDLDGDGELETGRGIAYRDEASDFELTAGTIPPAGLTYSEDADGNGVLDREIPDLIWSTRLGAADAASAQAGWQLETIRLTREEATRLAESRAARLLIVHDGSVADPRTGRVLLGGIDVLGSGFAVDYPTDPPDAPSVSVRERSESMYSGQRLAQAFPEVAARFSSQENDQRLLSVSWSDLGTTDPIVLTRPASVPISDYASLRLYHRLAPGAASGATIALRALSDSGVVAEAEAPLTAETWSELAVALPASSDELVSSVRIELRGADTSEVLIDELSLWEPRSSIGSIAELDLTWRPAAELTLGGTRVVSEIGVKQRITAQTAAFPDDLTAARSGVESSTEAGANILGADVDLGLDVLANRHGHGMQLRHELRIPITPLSLVISDYFRAGYELLGPGTTHASELAAQLGRIGALTIGWRSDQAEAGSVDWEASARAMGGEQRAAGGITFSGRAEVGLHETRAPRATRPYPQAWAFSFADIVPAGEVAERSGSVALSGDAAFRAARIELRLDSTFSAREESRRRGVELDYEAVLPFRTGDETEVTLGFRRDAELVADGSPAPGALSEAEAAWDLLAAHPLPVALLPGWELVAGSYAESAAALTRGLLSASYRPEVSLEFRRNIRSSPWSYLVPTSARIEIARPAGRESDAVRTGREIVTDAFFIAPNVFGRLGSNPVFGFYDTDEYQASVRVALSSDEATPWRADLGIDHDVRLIWMDGRSIRLESTFTGTFPSGDDTSVTSRLAYVTEAPTMRFGWLPVPVVLDSGDRTLARETALVVEYDAGARSRLLGRVEHSSELIFGNNGSLRIFGGGGIGHQESDGRGELLLGVRIGIEGELRL